jgi:hypothetical protein
MSYSRQGHHLSSGNLGGLWGRILLERKSLIKNDVHRVPHSGMDSNACARRET